MRVLQVVHQSLPAWVGGTEIYTHTLSRALARRGHAVAVFAREPGAGGLAAETLEGVTIHRFRSAGRSEARRFLATFQDQPALQAFDTVLRQTRPDLVHFQHLLGLPAAVFWRAAQAGVSLVITLHDYWYVCANTKLLTNYSLRLCRGPRAWLNCALCGLARSGLPWAAPLAPALAPVFALRDHVLRRILQRADRLVAPTEFVRRTYEALGAPADRLTVIEHGIAAPSAAPPARDPAAPFAAAYVGGVAWQKGAHVLVEAFNRMPPAARLWIAGDMAREPEYAAALRASARHPGIEFLGQLSRDEIWALLDRADVIVVPSVWYETSSLVVQEAFARRRPVIASRLGALAERVRDGVDGLLVAPGDSQALYAALDSLASNAARLAEFEAAIRPVRTIEAHVNEMEALYAGARQARAGTE